MYKLHYCMARGKATNSDPFDLSNILAIVCGGDIEDSRPGRGIVVDGDAKACPLRRRKLGKNFILGFYAHQLFFLEG